MVRAVAAGLSRRPSPAYALLVVEAGGRHVGEQHRVEGADVDASLHRRRHGEDLDAVGDRDVVLTDEGLLEPGLARLGVDAVGLPCELGGTKREVSCTGPGLPRVVVVVEGARELHWAARQFSPALRAEAHARVEMRTPTAAAGPDASVSWPEGDSGRVDGVLRDRRSPSNQHTALDGVDVDTIALRDLLPEAE